MNLQTVKNQKGFTIVELLIVIVVIGILAAITIVAFNGIQNRAKSTSGQSLANSIVKKLESYNSIVGTYPTQPSQLQGQTESKVDALTASVVGSPADSSTTAWPYTVAAVNIALTGTTAENGKRVVIAGNATGGKVYYWDYSVSSGNVKGVNYGDGVVPAT